MTHDITDYFLSIIKQSPSLDIAEAEFKRAIADSPELRAQYRQWCAEQGSTERSGFKDFCEEYIDSQIDVWNTLTDYDE